MAGKAQKAGKSKRSQSEHKKLARARCRRNAAQRHEQLARQQELRHQANLRLDREMTPWQRACAERAARRLEICAGCRIRFAGEGKCITPGCFRLGESVNLKTAWEKRHVAA